MNCGSKLTLRERFEVVAIYALTLVALVLTACALQHAVMRVNNFGQTLSNQIKP